MGEFKVRVIRSKRRTVGLEVTHQGKLVVRAPYHLNLSELEEILQRHRNWIRKKVREVQSQQTLVQSKKFCNGERFLYLGKEYPLHLVSSPRSALIFDGQSFQLSLARVGLARELFERWYRKQARTDLSRRVEQLAAITGFKFEEIRISSARSRWGSCSAKGTISLTWRLIMAPPDIIDYVIIHELAHTLEKNHSRAFWQLVEKHLPDYRERRRWLRINGFLLNL
jgi:hypothetical protein